MRSQRMVLMIDGPMRGMDVPVPLDWQHVIFPLFDDKHGDRWGVAMRPDEKFLQPQMFTTVRYEIRPLNTPTGREAWVGMESQR